MESVLIVISDLHIGLNDEFDIFSNQNKHELFASFLDQLSESKQPVDLVINGDFIDFLQIRPWGDFNREIAVEKMQKVVACNSSIFQNLGKFLQNQTHKLRILPGNHDIELAYPEVGNILRQTIFAHAPGSEGQFALFDSSDNRRITYHPEINGILIHIEHGNEGDYFNTLNYQQLFNDAETGTTDFIFPPGTQLVYDVMNPFKSDLKFVDLLKPEMPAVPALLLALKPFLAASKIPAAVLQILNSLGNGLIAGARRKISGLPLGNTEKRNESSIDLFASTALAELPDEFLRPDDLNYYFTNSRIGGPSASPVLGGGFDSVRLKLLEIALRGLTYLQPEEDETAFYNRDHHNAAAKQAQTRLQGNVKVVVFGHTHEALKSEFDNGLYLNSGTWANLIQMPKTGPEERLAWLESLSSNSFMRMAKPTYVKLSPNDVGITAQLNEWTGNGEKVLWQKNISRSS